MLLCFVVYMADDALNVRHHTCEDTGSRGTSARPCRSSGPAVAHGNADARSSVFSFIFRYIEKFEVSTLVRFSHASVDNCGCTQLMRTTELHQSLIGETE